MAKCEKRKVTLLEILLMKGNSKAILYLKVHLLTICWSTLDFHNFGVDIQMILKGPYKENSQNSMSIFKKTSS